MDRCSSLAHSNPSASSPNTSTQNSSPPSHQQYYQSSSLGRKTGIAHELARLLEIEFELRPLQTILHVVVDLYGRSEANLNATITASLGPLMASRTIDITDVVTGFGDLYPTAALRWNKGVDNYMVYVTGDLPVGLYNSSQLANIGLGHYAVDTGGGYTYFNPQTGREFSANEESRWRLRKKALGFPLGHRR
jgi:hypothetical protein